MNLNFSIIPNAEAPLPPNPTIYPPCGPVTGVFRKNVTSYKGIPFAKPPVGPLRFRPPEPAPAWISPRECFEFSDKCLQFGGILADLPPMYSAIGKSEDCLYLNVWTPATAPGENALFTSTSTAAALPPAPAPSSCSTAPIWPSGAWWSLPLTTASAPSAFNPRGHGRGIRQRGHLRPPRPDPGAEVGAGKH